jgi:hypothetical protein
MIPKHQPEAQHHSFAENHPCACSQVFFGLRQYAGAPLLVRFRSAPVRFKVNGEVRGSYFPGYFLAAIVTDQLITQVFTTVIDGFGLWSFVAQGKGTRVVFHHVASGNLGDEMLARVFYWRGLLENLAAFCEGRPAPFERTV